MTAIPTYADQQLSREHASSKRVYASATSERRTLLHEVKELSK